MSYFCFLQWKSINHCKLKTNLYRNTLNLRVETKYKYFLRLKRQEFILLLKCWLKKEGKDLGGISELGVKTTGVCKGWWEPASKGQKGKCQFTVHCVPSSRMPRLKEMRKEQAETPKPVIALHHKALLLSPLTSPISTPSVFFLTPLWPQTLQTWPMLGFQLSYHLFKSLRKTLICHHQWWIGAAVLRIRQYSKWLADPNHTTLKQDSVCLLSNTQIWVCSHSHVFIYTCAFTHTLTPMYTSTQSCRFTHFYMLVHALIHTHRHTCAHTRCPHSSNIWNRLILGCSGLVRRIVGSKIMCLSGSWGQGEKSALLSVTEESTCRVYFWSAFSIHLKVLLSNGFSDFFPLQP